ncbi:hypothetical protein BD289DRAFT_492945 [Coniella lustricola]|uniref:F-box domain-containing protein n=1 Tax=Coniella lustricola TaxID=2025994 RepID=A0A2T3AGC6_9PEZI|nr:hypothetical protein BD289DRAFT_492945 [Coniella lustricola]
MAKPASCTTSSPPNAIEPPGAGSSKLLDLPPELKRQIAEEIICKDDLRNLRLTSVHLEAVAAEQLYDNLELRPQTNNLQRWSFIIQHKRLRHIPREISICVHASECLVFRPALFKSLCEGLTSLPNITSLEINYFYNRCSHRPEPYELSAVRHEGERDYHERTLHSIFHALMQRQGNAEYQRIRTLAISSLDSVPFPSLTGSASFRDVIKDVDDLVLGFQQQTDFDYGSEEGSEQLRTFPHHLCTYWLKPIAHQLKSLVLCGTPQVWGPFPGSEYFDLSGVSFPKLEALSIERFLLAHNDALDWVIAQKTLREIFIADCYIVTRILISTDDMVRWEPKTHDWVRLPQAEQISDEHAFEYEGKWSDVFSKLADGLPNLEAFVYYELQPDQIYTEFPQRYMIYDNRNGSDPWIVADKDGDLTYLVDGPDLPNFHQERKAEDQKSLYRLLEQCRAKRDDAVAQGINASRNQTI